MPTILEMTDVVVPQIIDDVEFYTVDPETQSFVLFGSTITSSDQMGISVPVYLISNTEIPTLTVSIQSSSNIEAKILVGNASKYDFVGTDNNNSISVENILSNTPVRLTIFYAISTIELDFGDIEIIWSY